MADFVAPTRSHGLADILDRVLDKGLVIAGDIKINLANVELLTIQVRLLICSIDKAEQIGMNWWRSDPRLSAPAQVMATVMLLIGGLSWRSRPISIPPKTDRPSPASERSPASRPGLRMPNAPIPRSRPTRPMAQPLRRTRWSKA